MINIHLHKIFLKTFKPTTSTQRFKKKIINIFIQKKNKALMYLKKNNNVRPKGTKLILSKGRLIKINNPVLDIKKN